MPTFFRVLKVKADVLVYVFPTLDTDTICDLKKMNI